MSEYIVRLQEAIASSIRGMSHEDMLRKPEGKWSTAEILEHLYLSYTGTVKGCERSLSLENLDLPPQTLSQRLKTLVIVRLGYFPRGIKAPLVVVPKGTPVEQVVAGTSEQIKKMEQLIARCESRYGKQAKLLKHPVLGGLTGDQWRKFHWVHGRHHVRQIIELRKKMHPNEKAPETPGA
jgi:Protein of unknown function (DUF1569)